MKLFQPKDANPSRPPAKGERAIPSAGDAASNILAHRVTKDLERSETLAAMLAQSRASQVLEVADLLAGMYIYGWERLSRFWKEDSQDAIESYVQQICEISPQRWHQWIEDYDEKRRNNEPRKLWRLLQPKQKKPPTKPLERSAELSDVLKLAEELSPARDMVDGRPVPILTCECVLLAIAKKTGSEIGHRLVATGLDVIALEESARNPKRAPRH